MEFNKVLFMSALTVTVTFSNTAQLSIFELPSSNMETVFQHQKELVGQKRAPQAVVSHGKADQIISRIVYTIVLDNLPKKYKKDATKVASAIIEEANRYGFDPLFLTSIIRQESVFNPNAKGSVGELGLMQIRPETAKWLNDKNKIVKKVNLRDPVVNIKIGAFYMNKLRDKFDQNSRWYISAYNMGPNKLKKKIAENVKPKEYVQNVMRHYVAYVDKLNTAFMQAEEELELFEMPLPTVALNQ